MKKLFLAFALLVTMIFPLWGCGEETTSTEGEETTVAAEEETSVFETVPEGFRVMTVGSGNPQLDLNAGGGSTLVQYQDKYFLVDCGFNTVATLMKNGLRVNNITNMLFTHQHNDHNADFWTFFVGGWGSPDGRRSLNLVGPEVQALYDTTVNFYRTDLEYRSQTVGFPSDGTLTNVNITDFTATEETIEIDGVKITAIPVPHTISTYAYKFEAGGETVVVSGDMKYLESFSTFAQGADILVIDGMMTSDYADVPEAFRETLKANLAKSHILNDEIGQLAAASGVKNLVLTHLGASLSDDYKAGIEAGYEEQGFTGTITWAYDGMTVEP